MNIGTGKKIKEGQLAFITAIPFLAPCELTFQELKKEGNANAPDYEILFQGMKIGAAWKKDGKKGPYMSCQIEHPVMPGGRMNFSVFPVREGDRKGEMDMVWNPPQREARTSDGAVTESRSTAGPDDDDIPF